MIQVAKSRLEVILLIFCFVVSQPTFETDLITDHFRERNSLCFFTTRSFLRTWRSMNAFLHTPVTFSSGFAARATRLPMPQPFLSLFPHPWHK